MYLDLVIKEAANNQPQINVLAYADDIAQLDSTEEDLQLHLKQWNESFTKYGLKLNLDKTEIVVLSRIERNTNIKVGDKTIKQATSFKYLGSMISQSGLIDHEINTRIKKF